MVQQNSPGLQPWETATAILPGLSAAVVSGKQGTKEEKGYRFEYAGNGLSFAWTITDHLGNSI
jgi:hypothetical protein